MVPVPVFRVLLSSQRGIKGEGDNYHLDISPCGVTLPNIPIPYPELEEASLKAFGVLVVVFDQPSDSPRLIREPLPHSLMKVWISP